MLNRVVPKDDVTVDMVEGRVMAGKEAEEITFQMTRRKFPLQEKTVMMERYFPARVSCREDLSPRQFFRKIQTDQLTGCTTFEIGENCEG